MINTIRCLEKPNHNLTYTAGTEFCLEDPVNTPFQITITCPLANEPQPPPMFHWSIYYNIFNDSESDLDDSLPSLQVFNDNSDTLILIGTVGLDGESTLSISCIVDNLYGYDVRTTEISPCGEI